MIRLRYVDMCELRERHEAMRERILFLNETLRKTITPECYIATILLEAIAVAEEQSASIRDMLDSYLDALDTH